MGAVGFNLLTGQWVDIPHRPRDGVHIGFGVSRDGGVKIRPYVKDSEADRPTDWGRFDAGDHVKVQRGLYTHHGIYCGDGTIIHYAPNSGTGPAKATIRRTSVDEFEGTEGKVSLVQRAGFRADQVLANARARLGESSYDLLLNNCEHFAYDCFD